MGHEADARRWSCCAIFLIDAVVTDGGAHGASGWLDRWVKLAEVRGAELDRTGGKGKRELEGKAAGEHLYLAQHRAGRLGASDTIPGTAGGEAVTRPLTRIA